MSRLTIRALRHYDDIGLLRPARVDPGNGYRYYTAEQIVHAGTIAVLRSLNLDISTIASLLAGDIELDVVIDLERNRLDEIQRQHQDAVDVLECLSTQTAAAVPTVVDSASFSIVGTHIRVTATEDVTVVAALFDEIFAALNAGAVKHDKDGVCLIRRNTRDEMWLDVGVETLDPEASIDGYERIDIAGGPTAKLIHEGPLTSLPLGHARLAAWVHANGFSPKGPARETYLGVLEAQRTEIAVGVVQRHGSVELDPGNLAVGPTPSTARSVK